MITYFVSQAKEVEAEGMDCGSIPSVISEGIRDLTQLSDWGNMTHAASLSKTSWVALWTVTEVITIRDIFKLPRTLWPVAASAQYCSSMMTQYLTDLCCLEEML